MLIAAFDESTACVTQSKKAVKRSAGKEIIWLIHFMNLFSDIFPICCLRNALSGNVRKCCCGSFYVIEYRVNKILSSIEILMNEYGSVIAILKMSGKKINY